jgi:hypothetical protein
MRQSTKVRSVLFLPLGGSKTKGAHVDMVLLPSGTIAYSLWGECAPKFFTEPHEAFDAAFSAMGWNVTATQRYDDDS